MSDETERQLLAALKIAERIISSLAPWRCNLDDLAAWSVEEGQIEIERAIREAERPTLWRGPPMHCDFTEGESRLVRVLLCEYRLRLARELYRPSLPLTEQGRAQYRADVDLATSALQRLGEPSHNDLEA